MLYNQSFFWALMLFSNNFGSGWAGNRCLSLCYNRPDPLNAIVLKVKPFKDCNKLIVICGCIYFY